MSSSNWYALSDTHDVISPSLLVYPDRIEKNIHTMISMAGGTNNLRPHIKTHKTAEIINLQLEAGIFKYKCATIAEAELLALCGAPDILLAMQPVGANVERFFKLVETYPNSKFSALVDHPTVLESFATGAKKRGIAVSLWMDINNGMNRTGIIPNKEAVDLYKMMTYNPTIEAMGLHAYDGHLRHPDPIERKKSCDKAFVMVEELKNSIEAQAITVTSIIAGGSPTFPFHGAREGVETSPGTTLLWDAGYAGLFPEMDFLIAGVLLTRIVSKPKPQILCLDLGHKSIAPEMGFPRVQFLGMDDFEQIGQSEEHLVLKCESADGYDIGDVLYAVPMHICPTIAKQAYLQVVKDKKIIASWKVAARNQKINI